jgi:hypothetical protein
MAQRACHRRRALTRAQGCGVERLDADLLAGIAFRLALLDLLRSAATASILGRHSNALGIDFELDTSPTHSLF